MAILKHFILCLEVEFFHEPPLRVLHLDPPHDQARETLLDMSIGTVAAVAVVLVLG